MHIYLKNIHVEFHSDSIWNDRALGFLTRSRPKQEQEQEQKEQQQDERYEISSWTEYVVIKNTQLFKVKAGFKDKVQNVINTITHF